MNTISDAQWTTAAAILTVFMSVTVAVYFAPLAAGLDMLGDLGALVLLSLFVASSLVIPSWVAPRGRVR
jgi:hypothetical protein